MKIIGLTGKARSGKDTVGKYLCENHGYVRVSFAEPLKDMVGALIGLDPDKLELIKDNQLPVIGYSPRELLQTLGTEWGRQTLHENFWVDIARAQITDLKQRNKCSGIVITDARFENEATMLRDMGGIMVHIDRDCSIHIPKHSSENGIKMNEEDYLIYNIGDKGELWDQVEHLLTCINSRK